VTDSVCGEERRDEALKILVLALATALMVVLASSDVAEASSNKPKVAATSLKTQLLAASDVPAGWAPASDSSSSGDGAPPQCFAGLEGASNKSHNPSVSFEQGSDGPQFAEALVSAKGKAIALLSTLKSAMDSCGTISYNSGGENAKIQISDASFPKIGDQSEAFKLLITASIFSIPGYIVATERKNNEVALYTYFALGGNASESSLVRLVKDGEAKIEGKKSPDYRSAGPFTVGQTAKFNDGQGDSANITLVRVVDPAQGADQYTTPSAGGRFVTTEFKIVNTGKAFEPEPTSDVTVFDTASHSFSSTYQDVQGCPAFADNLTLAHGDTADGCVTFEIPTGSALQKIQYSEQSGGGTAAWTLTPVGTSTTTAISGG
jgi:Domain of unknown function (DUF4352)